MNKIKDLKEREYYLKPTIENGWIRNILSDKQNNFNKTLLVHIAEQIDKAMKDIYIFDFLGITESILEKELEQKMLNLKQSMLVK